MLLLLLICFDNDILLLLANKLARHVMIMVIVIKHSKTNTSTCII